MCVCVSVCYVLCVMFSITHNCYIGLYYLFPFVICFILFEVGFLVSLVGLGVQHFKPFLY